MIRMSTQSSSSPSIIVKSNDNNHKKSDNKIIRIRAIEKKDNQQMASIILSVLDSYNAPKEGTAAADTSVLQNIYETYQTYGDRSAYFVCCSIEKNYDSL